MKAITQNELIHLQDEVQAEYEANQHKIAELEAKQSELRQALSRFTFHKALMGERAVPDYAPWLPFSS
jgi:hypothetical protein